MQIIKGSHGVQAAVVDQLNRLRDISVGSNFHASKTALPPSGDPPVATVLSITAAAPTTLATRVALANDVKRVLNEHFKDDLAHDSDVSDQIATAAATDEATAITLANACKDAYEAHRTESNVHFNNDATNTIAAADASDTGSLDTLLAELKTDINAHIAAALAGDSIKLIPA